MVEVRHVVLPWARPEAASPDAYAEAARRRVEADARAVRINQDRLAIRRKGGRAQTDWGRAQDRGATTPLLLAAALPYKPHPSIPDEDRAPLEEGALIGLAVALDVLATRTRPIEATHLVLAELADALLVVGKAGGIDKPALTRLLGHASSEVGHSRAILTRHLSGCMAAEPRPPESTEEVSTVGAAHPSTPRAMGRALRRIEAAADVAIREASLRLEACEPIEYRQA